MVEVKIKFGAVVQLLGDRKSKGSPLAPVEVGKTRFYRVPVGLIDFDFDLFEFVLEGQILKEVLWRDHQVDFGLEKLF